LMDHIRLLTESSLLLLSPPQTPQPSQGLQSCSDLLISSDFLPSGRKDNNPTLVHILNVQVHTHTHAHIILHPSIHKYYSRYSKSI
jgi:hypothetical protein